MTFPTTETWSRVEGRRKKRPNEGERRRVVAGTGVALRSLARLRPVRRARRRVTPRSREPVRSDFRGEGARRPCGARIAQAKFGSSYAASPRALRRRTTLFHQGGPRLGERPGTSVGSPMPARNRLMLFASVTMAINLRRPVHFGHSRTSAPVRYAGRRGAVRREKMWGEKGHDVCCRARS